MAKMRRRFTPGEYALRVGRSRTGRGLYAKAPIRKGACVLEYTGRPVSDKEQYENRGKYLFWTGRGTMINGNIPGNLARHINHSCQPNCEVDVKKRRIYIFAIKNIKADEELTYHYGEEYFEMYFSHGRCRCLSCVPRA